MQNATVFINSYVNNKKDFDAVVSGTVYTENNTTFISYTNGANETCVGLSDNLITVNTLGDTCYTIVFEKDKRANFSLKTQYGQFYSSICPKVVDYKINKNDITVKLNYNISFDDKISENTKLSIRAQLTQNEI